MKSPRVLGVSVVALLLLGATTGTTLALWRDTATAASTTVTAGSVSLTVGGTQTATLTGPTGLQPGVGQVVSTTVRNASVAAPNMRMQVFLDTVTSSNANLTSNVEVAPAVTSGSCAVATSGFKTVAAWTSTQVTSTALTAQAGTTLCLTVRLISSPAATAYGQTGTLTLTFRGQQVRP